MEKRSAHDVLDEVAQGVKSQGDMLKDFIGDSTRKIDGRLASLTKAFGKQSNGSGKSTARQVTVRVKVTSSGMPSRKPQEAVIGQNKTKVVHSTVHVKKAPKTAVNRLLSKALGRDEFKEFRSDVSDRFDRLDSSVALLKPKKLSLRLPKFEVGLPSVDMKAFRKSVARFVDPKNSPILRQTKDAFGKFLDVRKSPLLKQSNAILNRLVDTERSPILKGVNHAFGRGSKLMGSIRNTIDELNSIDVGETLKGIARESMSSAREWFKQTKIGKGIKKVKDIASMDVGKVLSDWKLAIKERFKQTRIGKGLLATRQAYRATRDFMRTPVSSVARMAWNGAKKLVPARDRSMKPDAKMKTIERIAKSQEEMSKKIDRLAEEVSSISKKIGGLSSQQQPKVASVGSAPSAPSTGTKVPANVMSKGRRK